MIGKSLYNSEDNKRNAILKMLIEREKLMQKYWRYYLHLENEFIKTCDYVEISTSNYSTFSNEYASLIQ